MAREDKSPLVRLYLASAMQRLPLKQRVPVLKHICSPTPRMRPTKTSR